MAAAGYAVASVGYQLARKGAPSYPTNIQQCFAALDFLLGKADEYGIDPDSLVAMWESAEAHLALMTGLVGKLPRFHPSRSKITFRGIIDFYGISNLNSRLTTLDDGTPTSELDDGNSELYTGARRGTQPDLWAEDSPVNDLDATAPPLFVVHSDNDTTVDRNQSKELVNSYRQVLPSLALVSSTDQEQIYGV